MKHNSNIYGHHCSMVLLHIMLELRIDVKYVDLKNKKTLKTLFNEKNKIT